MLRLHAAPWLRAAGLSPVLMLALAAGGSGAQAPDAAPRRPADISDTRDAETTGASLVGAAIPLDIRRWDAPVGPRATYHVPSPAIADRVRSSGAARGARRGAVMGAGVGGFIGLTAALAQTDDAGRVATTTLLSSALLSGVGAAVGALIGGLVES